MAANAEITSIQSRRQSHSTGGVRVRFGTGGGNDGATGRPGRRLRVAGSPWEEETFRGKSFTRAIREPLLGALWRFAVHGRAACRTSASHRRKTNST